MMKIMAYLTVVTSLIGASVISIDLGVFQLSIFRAIIIFMLCAAVTKLLLRNGKISLNKKSENNYSIIFMLIWLTYAVMTLGWVDDYNGWVRAIYFLSLGVICVVLYSSIFNTVDDIMMMFRAMAIMIILHNLIGWYEINTGNYMFLSIDRIILYSRYNYPVTMFGNSNDFASFMLFSVFITYICAANTKRVLWKFIYIVTMVSSGYLLIITGSRANILGLIVSIAVFIYLSMQNQRARQTILIILTIIFIFTLFTPHILTDFFLMISGNLEFGFSKQTGSDAIRQNLIKNGFLFLISTFGFGTGAGNIEYWMVNYGTYYTDGVANIHNWWMEILTGYGVVIFVMYITFYLKLFSSMYRRYRTSKDKTDITISLGIMCSMAGFVIGSISSSSNISSEWLWVFWAIAIAFQGINLSPSPTLQHQRDKHSNRIN